MLLRRRRLTPRQRATLAVPAEGELNTLLDSLNNRPHSVPEKTQAIKNGAAIDVPVEFICITTPIKQPRTAPLIAPCTKLGRDLM